MTYTIWFRGRQIGTTTFERTHRGRKRAGTLHPTEFGIQVLPSITAMAPALFDFGEACKRWGVNAATAADTDASGVFEIVTATPEGKRLVAAAEIIGDLEVRDADEAVLPWESIIVTDFEWLMAPVRARREPASSNAASATPSAEPTRFMISLTFRREARRPLWPLRVKRPVLQ